MMRYAIMTYKAQPEYNVGDYIQSLAAAQYFPHVDQYINREVLSKYSGDQVKMILNGWFMHMPQNWPPSDQITPLLTSFHLNSQAKRKLLQGSSLDWFIQHAPVGCRDQYTFNAMQEAGVSAYISGCLTSTLKNKWNYRTEDIYFVDALFRVPDYSTMMTTPRALIRAVLHNNLYKGSQRNRLLTTIFDPDLLKKAKTVHHYHTARHSEFERFELAESFLEKYATAKLVVTSRLHCAIPCLAFGTPVIFMKAGFDKEEDQCRISGVTDLFNLISVDEDGSVRSNFKWSGNRITDKLELQNPHTYRSFVALLQDVCSGFVNDRVPNI